MQEKPPFPDGIAVKSFFNFNTFLGIVLGIGIKFIFDKYFKKGNSTLNKEKIIESTPSEVSNQLSIPSSNVNSSNQLILATDSVVIDIDNSTNEPQLSSLNEGMPQNNKVPPLGFWRDHNKVFSCRRTN